jgi:adenylate kinase
VRVILLGPPGAGKGTQAALIAGKLDIPRVSSGELFRDHQARDSELGRLARSYMATGVLVPDEVTIRMVMGWIEENAEGRGFLLDGFPRTMAQAAALDESLPGAGGVDLAIYVNVPEPELVRRLTGRLVCRGCQTQCHAEFAPPARPGICDQCGGDLYQREDDKPEAVRERFRVYLEETSPLIGYYRGAGKLREIKGEGPIDEVGVRLLEALDQAAPP